ncbi:MAG: outer membrane beta-barrel protein [Kiritimatiellae bacterium]|nr:outer membrane beta-barrel protein [Kiritimatiellia bacterium]
MKRMLVVLAVLLCTTGAALGYNAWGIYAAYWDTKDADDGFGAGGKASIEMIPGIQLELRAAYFNDLAKDSGDIDADLEVVPLEAGLALTGPIGERLEVYGGGGIGYYLMDGEVDLPDGAGVEADPGDEVGFYLAAGAEFTVRESGASDGKTEAVLFGEIIYRSVEVDDLDVESGATIELNDAKLDGLGFNVGLMVKW